MPSKILLAVNALSEIDSQPYPSHLIHAFRLGRDTDFECLLFTPRRMAIDNARNQAVEFALENECDYIFFWDDDMELHPHTLKTLLGRGKDIIMAMCYIRGYPFKPMVFRWVDSKVDSGIADVVTKGKFMELWEDCEDYTTTDGLIENVAAVGCAATLMRTEVFKYMTKPYFHTGISNTEDVFMCAKAQNQVEGVTIAVDTTVPVGHVLKDRRILYPWNASLLKKHEEEYSALLMEKANAELL